MFVGWGATALWGFPPLKQVAFEERNPTQTPSIKDLEQLQQEHPEWQMELVDGNIIVISPSDYESDEISFRG
ncbi:hypothetical protein NUACC21_13260 [Scytonema sp. NUACC21]